MTSLRPFLYILAVVCSTSVAFVVTPTFSSRPRPMAPPSTATMTPYDRPRQRHANNSLQAFVADYEEIEKQKRRDDDNKSSRKSWIPTPDGGFLPNLRGIANRGKTATKQKSKNPLIEVSTIEDYKEQVVDFQDGLVCVRFFAPWCRACKAIESRYRQLATKYPNVRFVQVPVTQDNAVLHNALGIPALPFGHIYHPDVGLVDERSLNRKVFAKFEKELDTYVKGECPVEWDDEEEEPLQ